MLQPGEDPGELAQVQSILESDRQIEAERLVLVVGQRGHHVNTIPDLVITVAAAPAAVAYQASSAHSVRGSPWPWPPTDSEATGRAHVRADTDIEEARTEARPPEFCGHTIEHSDQDTSSQQILDDLAAVDDLDGSVAGGHQFLVGDDAQQMVDGGRQVFGADRVASRARSPWRWTNRKSPPS